MDLPACAPLYIISLDNSIYHPLDQRLLFLGNDEKEMHEGLKKIIWENTDCVERNITNETELRTGLEL